MRKALARAGVVLVTGCALVGGTAVSAHAAPPGGAPPVSASCVGQIFVPQATGEPGTVARRIAEIKEFLPLIEVKNFGEPISGLARTPKDDCAGDG